MFLGVSMRSKLIVFFLIVIMIPSILITTIMYIRSTMILGEKKGDSIVNGLEQTGRVMDTILSDAEYQLTFLTTNPENLSDLLTVSRQLDYSQDPLAKRIWTRIYDYCVSNQNILAIYFYLYSPKLMFTSFQNRKVIEVNNPEYYHWLNIPVHPETNSSGWLPMFVIPESLASVGRSSFLLKKNIKSKSLDQPLGEACVAVEEYFIRHNLLDSIREGSNGIVMLLDQSGTVLSAVSNRNIFRQSLAGLPYIERILTENKGSFVDKIDGEKMLIGFTTSKYTGWKYVSMAPMREITLNTVEIRNYAFLVTLLSATLAISLALIFSQSIYQPIRVLKEAMKLAASGNLKVQIDEERKDEFGILNRSFNRMILQIKRLIEELYHEKLLKKEAELKSLQSQINPHFLYNTLDSIHWLARLNKLAEVTQLTFALSNFYKLSLGGGKETITAQETINLIQEYLQIQQIRYGDKIRVEVNVNESLLLYQVLPLIIQPLVENAIYHGIEKKKGPGWVKVSLSPWEKGMVFTVKDDGVGITPAKLNQIRESLKGELLEETFALVNIQKRIQLYYGMDYGLEIESKVGQGTTTKLYLPCWEQSKQEEVAAFV